MKSFIGIKTESNKKAMEKLLKKKSLSTLKKDLETVFNLFIRLRDTEISQGKKFFTCISCGHPKELTEMHAGHYWPAGGHEAVRFDEDNVHGQCRRCNFFKHGNEKGYRGRLIKKIGEPAFTTLGLRAHNKSKMMAFEVEYLIQEYKSKIEKLKKI